MRPLVIALCFVLAFRPLVAQEFEVVSITEAGPTDTRINLVFLGDGYQDFELDKFIGDVQDVQTQLFRTTPFKEYKDHFNVFAIKVPSNVSGAARDPSALIDNYFGSTYNFAGIERLLVPTKNGKVSAVLAENFPEYDQVFMLVNDQKYGGSGGWIATSSTNPEAGEIGIHEIGHSFAGLADEYWAGEQFAWESDNMTQNNSTSTVKWKNWLGEGGIGIYPHTGDPTWYKPFRNCKMEFLGSAFCAVCRESFIKVIHELTNSIDAFTPGDQNSLNDPQVFEFTPLSPTPNTLSTYWEFDSEITDKDVNSVSVQLSELTGNHTLSLNVVDATEMSRKDVLEVSSLVWAIQGGAESQITTTLRTSTILRTELDNQVVTSIDDEFIRTIELKAFPNPVTDRLVIEFNNPKPAYFELQLVDLQGKAFQKTSETQLPPGQQRFEVNTSAIQKGLFLVQLRIGDRIVIHKVLK